MLADDLGISTARAADGAQWIGLMGELDVQSAHRLADVIERLLAEGYDRFRIDLSSLRFVDSSGLGVLVRVNKAVHDAGGELTVGGASPSVQRVFEIVGLDRLVTIGDLGAYEAPVG